MAGKGFYRHWNDLSLTCNNLYMMYKLKKYYAVGVDRRSLLEESYAKGYGLTADLDHYAQQDFWPLLQKTLSSEKKYLDAGCGVGGWLLFLKEKGYHVEGFDEAARIVRAITEYDPDVEVKQGSMTAMPYPDGSFDGVLTIGSLDHQEDGLDQVFTELKRVLKPQGIIFIEVPLLNSLRRVLYVPLKKIQAGLMRYLGRKEVFAGYLFDRTSIDALLVKHGFEVVSVQPHDIPSQDGHYGLYIDWPLLRGQEPYRLNMLGSFIKVATNSISLWLASTGMVVVARKK